MQVTVEKDEPQKTIITGKLINYHRDNVSVQRINPFDLTSLETLELAEYHYIAEADSFYLVLELEQPMEIMMWFKSLYAKPGDSIHLVYEVIEHTKNKHVDTLYASGKNAGNYDFFWYSYKNGTKRFPSILGEGKAVYLNNINLFKRDCEKVYFEAIRSIEQQSKHANITPEALIHLKKKIFGLYLWYLVSPIMYEKISPDNVPDNYLADIETRVLSDSLLLASRGWAMEDYLLSLPLLKMDVPAYSPAHFKRTLELIKEHANETTRAFLFYATVLRFTENRNWQFTSEMEAVYTQMLATVEDSIYRRRIVELGFNPNDVMFRSSDALKAISLQDQDGKQTTFGDMINEHLHDVIYIDIWASWCVPCRTEMPYASKVRETYKDKAVSFVYLSIDNDKESWKKASSEEKLLDLGTNYVLEKPGDFGVLRKEFKFTGIPRYVLIDQSGNVAFANAPRPSSVQIQKAFDNLLNTTVGAPVPPPPLPKAR